jgi:transporter family protein
VPSSWSLIAIAAVLYGLHNVFTRAAGPRIDETLGALLLEGFAALIILGFTLYKRWQGGLGLVTREGVLWSLAAGLCVGLGTLAFFALFSRGGELSVAGPSVLVGGSLFMVLGGILLFGEAVSALRLLGIVLGLISLFLLRYKS